NSLVLGSINGVNNATADTNVGIGTTAPSQLLHINSTFSNAAALVQAPTHFFAQYQLKSGATDPWIVGTQDNFAFNALLIRNGTVDRMTVLPSGDVGIGTTPTSRLDVFGDIRVGVMFGCVKDHLGTVIAGTCGSDARLKRDVRAFPRLLEKLV